MSEDNKILNIILVVFVLLIVTVLFLNKNRTDWTITLDKEEMGPYDLKMFMEFTKVYAKDYNYEEIQDTTEQLLDSVSSEDNNIYLLIDKNIQFGNQKLEKIRNFILDGNTAFVSTMDNPTYLIQYLNVGCKELHSHREHHYPSFSGVSQSFYDSSCTVKFMSYKLDDDEHEFAYNYKEKLKMTSWKYANDNYYCQDDNPFDTHDYNILSKIYKRNEMYAGADFIHFKVGEGDLFIHFNPTLFTNYFLTEREGQEYVEKVFSHLQKGNLIIDHNLQQMDFRDHAEETDEDSYYSSKRDLAYIYIRNSKSLSIAYYLGFAGILAFLIFYVKKRQQSIDLFERKKNVSLNFVKTISRLYFSKKAHRSIGKHIFNHFLDFLRTEYSINTQLEYDELIENIYQKTAYPKDKLEAIFNKYKGLDHLNDISGTYLIDFHQMIYKFYDKVKSN